VSRPRGSNPDSPEDDPVGYTVVARRYRPQRFEDVVGQDHVVQALRNAIRLNRVTHAYLFSGTRGVGKTSIARIFAKCLNCVHGPTENPDQTCDICRAISVGQDVDVIEIDGASNNGVEQVRELRQNAGLRPSRARFKIYYIDEVHMLSTGAFNALLKTLEEPPSHVKFFFATTEPNKIPVTVLSRCQRYDFAGITPDLITETLAEICAQEKVEADPEALGVIARRAGGSMRDAQSLLEQLLSFGGERLTVELVQQQLGIASDDRTLDLLDALSRRDAAEAIRIVDQTASSGVQPTELLAGALDFLRDVMVMAVNPDLTMLAASPRQKPRLQEIAGRWPLDTLLAALQILAEARGRLRGSPHGRTLAEIAILRVARLENLGELGEIVARLAAMESGAPPVAAIEKKKRATAEVESEPEPLPPAAPPPVESVPDRDSAAPEKPLEPARPEDAPTDLSTIAARWLPWAESLRPELASKLLYLRPISWSVAGILVLEPLESYNWVVDAIERADLRSKIESSLRTWLGGLVVLQIQRRADVKASTTDRAPSTINRDEILANEPLHKLLVERLEARVVRIDVEDESAASES
jgi:DNA polymerase III subunit gamma/tau